MAKVSKISFVKTNDVMINLVSLTPKTFNLIHLKYPSSAGNFLISFDFAFVLFACVLEFYFWFASEFVWFYSSLNCLCKVQIGDS